MRETGVRMRRRIPAAVLALAVLCAYNSWVLASLSPHPHPFAGYLSELAAFDQPYGALFRTGDMIAGSLMGLIAGLGVRGWRDRFGRMSTTVAGAIAVAGLATISDAIWALPCSATFDTACSAEFSADPLRPNFLAHMIASTFVTVAGLISMILAVVAVRRQGRIARAEAAAGSRDGVQVSTRTGYAKSVAALAVVFTVTTLASGGIDMLWSVGHGYVQAIGVLTLGTWAAHLGYVAVMNGGVQRECAEESRRDAETRSPETETLKPETRGKAVIDGEESDAG